MNDETTTMIQPPSRMLDGSVDFLCEVGAALARYGERTDRLEVRLVACAGMLEVDAQFYVLPTAIFAAFGTGARARTVLINTEMVQIDLRSLTLVSNVLVAVAKGEMTAAQGLAEVRLITSLPPRFRWYWRVLAAGLAAAAIAVVLGGGPRALFAAAIVGLGVGVLVVVGRRVERLIPLLELLAGLLSALLTAVLWHVLPHFAVSTVMLAGLTPLIPGLAITRGVSELAAAHVVSGTSRLAGAAILLASLAVGVALGTYVLRALGWMPPTFGAHGRASEIVVLVSIMAGALAYVVLMNARPNDFPVILAAWAVALYGLRLGNWLVGPTLGIVIAAALLGLCCNLYGRFTGRPSAVPRVPAMVVLVPGAIGFQSAASVLSGSTSGIGILITVVVVAVGLVVGLLVADAAVPIPVSGRRPSRI
jgi:uncharacterized membrane protein YjjP (DUF1212 family)